MEVIATMDKKQEEVVAPEEIVLPGKNGDLKLKKTVDKNGNVFYKTPLNWREPENAGD
jgi:hypothetical protein